MTGVQTCALPILGDAIPRQVPERHGRPGSKDGTPQGMIRSIGFTLDEPLIVGPIPANDPRGGTGDDEEIRLVCLGGLVTAPLTLESLGTANTGCGTLFVKGRAIGVGTLRGCRERLAIG